MTEQTPTPGPAVQVDAGVQGDGTPAAPVEPRPGVARLEVKSPSKPRFAAYDKTYLRFVGGVHSTEAKAKAAAKKAGSTDFEIRDVSRVEASQHGALAFVSAALVVASEQARTISGVVVPWGVAGRTSAGVLTVARGSIKMPTDLKRIKLVDNHQQPPVAVGYATAAKDTDAGLEMTFQVGRTDAGDRALLEASEGLRDALSVELVDLTVDDNGQVTAAELSAVAQVAVPAFADARIANVAASQHAHTQPVVIPTRHDFQPATAPAMVHAAHTGSLSTERPLNDLYAALHRVVTGQSQPHAEAALADIVHSDIYGTVGQDSYVGQLWGNLGYQRRFVQLLRPGTLTSWKVKGWKWGVKPEVGDYAGEKTEIPTNQPTVVPAETEAARLAGGHDIDRKFRDFGDSEFIAAYLAAMTESYARKSDLKALAFILASASAGGATAAGQNLLHAAALAADKLDDNTDGMSADYVLVNRTDRRALLEVTNNNAPAYAEKLGVDWDKMIPTNQIPAGTVVAGVKTAGTFYELGGSPIRVEALDLARGGIDEALFGYWAALLHDSKGIVKTTITPAA